MTRAQKDKLAHVVATLCELRDECEDFADRFELGVLILEMAAPLARPCDDPEPTGAFDEFIR